MYLVLVEEVDLILSEVVDLFLGGGDLLPARGGILSRSSSILVK